LLRHPRTGWVAGDAQDVDTATGDLDHEEHIDPLEENGVDGEEITGEDTGRLSAQEGDPGGVDPAWRGVDTGLMQDPPDGRGPDPVTLSRSNIGLRILTCGYAAWWYSWIRPGTTGFRWMWRRSMGSADLRIGWVSVSGGRWCLDWCGLWPL
jgi:hypothetical protein